MPRVRRAQAVHPAVKRAKSRNYVDDDEMMDDGSDHRRFDSRR